MAECSFDQLLFALRVSVEAANDGLRRRRGLHYEHDRAGNEALHVDIPRGPRDDATLDPVVIPMSWFRDPRLPQVTELSVAFDCRLRYERVRGAADALIIDMNPPPPRWFRRRPLHRMVIRFRAADAWRADVSLDGRPVVVSHAGAS
ncbi:hypothetical protein J2X57_000058 [Luteibacter sp. 1214]|uniref:hypothetical protein n=1 Tax=Luteibacter sp. 1214 TaxID=2817735 RepID=UPI0028561E4B|nr:hypothetical protein [Luteibacter sp. 1214]MDR6640864.1 hypothetical protein [Luteibacter sp. 1214]